MTSSSVSAWNLTVSSEVETWLKGLSLEDFAMVAARLEYLTAVGNQCRMPITRPLGEGLFELRFALGNHAQRITFAFAANRSIVALTVFTKQRNSERREIARARMKMAAYRNG